MFFDLSVFYDLAKKGTAMITERRKRTRVPVGFDLNVVIKGKKVKVKTLNLSMTGVSFASPHAFTTGERCTVELVLNEEAHLSIEGKILRSEGEETIVSFLVMDEESFYHLKRLLQFNAADSDQIDQELRDPAFT